MKEIKYTILDCVCEITVLKEYLLFKFAYGTLETMESKPLFIKISNNICVNNLFLHVKLKMQLQRNINEN